MTERCHQDDNENMITSITESNETEEETEDEPNRSSWKNPIAKLNEIKNQCFKYLGDKLKSDEKSNDGPRLDSENGKLLMSSNMEDPETTKIEMKTSEEVCRFGNLKEAEVANVTSKELVSCNIDDGQLEGNIGAAVDEEKVDNIITSGNNRIVEVFANDCGTDDQEDERFKGSDTNFTDVTEIKQDKEDAKLTKIEEPEVISDQEQSDPTEVGDNEENGVAGGDSDIEDVNDDGPMFGGTISEDNETIVVENSINLNQENSEVTAAHKNDSSTTAKEMRSSEKAEDVKFSRHRSLLLEIFLKYFSEKTNEENIGNNELKIGHALEAETNTEEIKEPEDDKNSCSNDGVKEQNLFKKRVPYKQKKPEYFEMSRKWMINKNLSNQVDEHTVNCDNDDSQGICTAEQSREDNEEKEELNILILGQSGVGKSTWINSIVNYLKYKDLDEAEKEGVICVIPTNFVVTSTPAAGDEFIRRVIDIGGKDSNELTDLGKSGTQNPRTYTFYLGKKLVRLIDTPGLGDTEGLERDNENLNKIINHISFLKEIHGICLLLKSNETRLNALFKFCISGILANLHRNAARNIVFCFTNSRSSFYAPGDTTDVLEDYLRELSLTDLVSLSKETMFCLDNEAFRYLCILKYENTFQCEDREEYNRSWIKSVAETKRFFKEIQKLKPHSVTDTINLCSVQCQLYNLLRPVAEISIELQKNLTCVKESNMSDSENLKSKRQSELDAIFTIGSIFDIYLKKNNLLQDGNCFKEHLKELIRKENAIQENDHQLNKLIEHYEEKLEEFEILKKRESNASNLTMMGIDSLIKSLFDLELSGKEIQEKTKMKMKCARKAQMEAEKKLPIDVVLI